MNFKKFKDNRAIDRNKRVEKRFLVRVKGYFKPFCSSAEHFLTILPSRR